MKKNDGVSPVIGTILLVAITVVLVAIISAVVMGMTNDIGSSKIVGVQVSDNLSDATSGILVTITGGANANAVTNLTVYNGSTMLHNQSAAPMNVVGVPYAFKGVSAGLASISVVANFTDGTQQSVYTGSLNIV